MTTQVCSQDGCRAVGLALCLLISALTGWAQEEPAKPLRLGTVTANALNVRARPAQHYERIGQFSRGDRVTIVDETQDWLQVRVPEDTRGWVAAKYVSPDGVITGHNVRVHAGPGLVFTSFAKLEEKTVVEIKGPPVDAWQQVLVPETATGWVSRAYVRIDEPEEPVAAEEPEEPEQTVAADEPEDDTSEADQAPTDPEDKDDQRGPVVDTSGLLQAETMVIPKPPTAHAETTSDREKSDDGRDEQAETLAESTHTAATHSDDAGQTGETEADTTDSPGDTDDPVDEGVLTAENGQADSLEDVDAGDVATLGTSPAIVETTPGLGRQPQTQGPSTEPVMGAEDTAAEVTPAVEAGLNTKITAVEETSSQNGPASQAPTPAVNPLVMKTGILFSLKSQANEEATHVLGMKIGKTAYPVCYLKSSRVDLTEWERRTVRVYGREVRVPGWSKPVLDVYSIQIDMTTP